MNIFTPPSSITVPNLVISRSDINKSLVDYRKAEEKFVDDLRNFVIQRKKGKYIGKVVKFPVADGYARYMVASVKPLELVWMPLDDEYQFQYIDRLNWSDIKEKVEQQEALNKMFSKK